MAEKNWQVEYGKVIGKIAQLESENRQLRQQIESRWEQERAVRNKFKELLIDVLGRN